MKEQLEVEQPAPTTAKGVRKVKHDPWRELMGKTISAVIAGNGFKPNPIKRSERISNIQFLSENTVVLAINNACNVLHSYQQVLYVDINIRINRLTSLINGLKGKIQVYESRDFETKLITFLKRKAKPQRLEYEAWKLNVKELEATINGYLESIELLKNCEPPVTPQ